MREITLLNSAADYLDEGGDPFAFDFLADKDVSSDECNWLMTFSAMGMRFMAWALEDPEAFHHLMLSSLYKDSMDELCRLLEEFGKTAMMEERED